MLKLMNNIKEERGKMKIKFAKVSEGAKIPSKREEDAGYDIYACFEEDCMVIRPHTSVFIPTGIATAFDNDYVA
jgi:dUTP pyrophosphatase